MNYAICNETFAGWEHARICDFIAGLGYTGLEVAPFTWCERITDLSIEQLATFRRGAEAAGVQIIGLHWLLKGTEGFHLTSPDAAVQRRTGDYLAALARACATLGGSVLVLGSPQQRNLEAGTSNVEGHARAAAAIGHCLKVLEETGVRLCIEPLARSETNFLTTAADAVQLIERIGHPNVRLHLDVKAMADEAEPPAEIIKANAAWLEHFHANDPNLRGPGFGAMDFRPILQALHDIAYRGWVSVEVFDYAPDPETIARESIRYLNVNMASGVRQPQIQGERGASAP